MANRTNEILQEILEEIDKKIKMAKNIMVPVAHDELDRIANETAESFIVAYEECKDIIKSYIVCAHNNEGENEN